MTCHHIEGPPPGLATTFLDIFDCRKMSYNVEKCQGMSRNVEEFGREMSKNVEECREMLWNVEKCRRNDIKTHVGNDIFLHFSTYLNVIVHWLHLCTVIYCRKECKNIKCIYILLHLKIYIASCFYEGLQQWCFIIIVFYDQVRYWGFPSLVIASSTSFCSTGVC